MNWKTLISEEYKGRKIEICTKYDVEPLGNNMAVYLLSYIDDSVYDRDRVYKPLFSNSKNNKWAIKADQESRNMLLDIKGHIDEIIRKQEITDGLTDSLRYL